MEITIKPRIIMKGKLYILTAVLMLFSVQEIHATDYTLLEMLISTHKSLSNKLRTREEYDGLKASTSLNESAKSNSFSELVKKTSKRMGDMYSYVTFAADMVHITALTKEVVEMETKAVELSLKAGVDYPKISKKALELHKEFGEMTGKIVALSVFTVSAGLDITMATMQQRKDFTNFIQKELSAMRRKLSNFNFYAKAMMHLGKANLFERGKFFWELVDDTRILNGIKREIGGL